MFSMPYGSSSQGQADTFSDQSALQELLNFQKSLDRNFELPDLRKLSLNETNMNNSGSSLDGFSGFMTEAAKSNRDTESIQVRVPTSEHVAEIVGKQGLFVPNFPFCLAIQVVCYLCPLTNSYKSGKD